MAEKAKNNNGLVVGVLIGLFLSLIVGVTLFLTNTISFNTKLVDNCATPAVEDNITYTYNDVKGLYKYVGSTVTNNGEEYNPTFQLYLYENGTFSYDLSTALDPNVYLGNYIIDGNNIKLNIIFRQGSGVGVTPKSETQTLVINEDGSITGVESPITEINSSDIKLVKTTDNSEKEFLDNNDFSKIIDHTFEYNN